MSKEDIQKEIEVQKKKIEQTVQMIEHFKGNDLDDSQAQLLQSSVEQYRKEIAGLENKLDSMTVLTL